MRQADELEDFSSNADDGILVTPGEIATLATKSEGWEPIWGRVYGQMGLVLDKRLLRLNISWPEYGDGAREEFAASMLERLEKRFRNGVLFTEMPTENTDLAQAFFAKRFLAWKVNSFLRNNRIWSRCTSLDIPVQDKSGDSGTTRGDALDAGAQRPLLDDNRRIAGDYSEGREKLGLRLRNLSIAVATPSNPSVIEEQAGMQLYPRCDWSSDVMNRLHAALEEVLAPHLPEGADIDGRLTGIHCRRRDALEARFADLRNELGALGFNAKVKFASLMDRMNKTTFEFLFLPLNAESLMELLSIKRDNADMLRKRYRENLEHLLRGNPGLDDMLARGEGGE